ncbi:MAG TPA: NADPH-dependent FMN reductase [Pseudogracilibacillus sp.]|nr:NADPH-dependent FMN reductase [Pseudogracilibacillus sp.]
MNIVVLSGSNVGTNTKTVATHVEKLIKKEKPDATTNLLDLADYTIQFSDGRNYFDYEGDTKYVAETVMNADVIIIGTPIFQASIPATLKNVFDLIPVNGLQGKVVSIFVTAGSVKHYLIAEQQLKPILSYMKAQVVPTYVFIEEADFLRGEIVNDDIHFRLERLVEDTMLTFEAVQFMEEKQEEKYGF